MVITEYDIPPAETPTQLGIEDGSNWSEGTPSAYRNRGTHDVARWISTVMPGLRRRKAGSERSYAKIDTEDRQDH